jgi:hypothetical protein
MNKQDMLPGSRTLFVGVVACAGALLGCGGAEAYSADNSALSAAATTSVICTQVSPGRPTNRQTVTANLDASGNPVDVNVLRGPSAQLEHSTATATAVPGYQGGYFEQTYHLLAWNLGSEGANDYFFLLPDTGVTPGTFAAQLHLYFNHGDSGWWQKLLSCTAQ